MSMKDKLLALQSGQMEMSWCVLYVKGSDGM